LDTTTPTTAIDRRDLRVATTASTPTGAITTTRAGAGIVVIIGAALAAVWKFFGSGIVAGDDGAGIIVGIGELAVGDGQVNIVLNFAAKRGRTGLIVDNKGSSFGARINNLKHWYPLVLAAGGNLADTPRVAQIGIFVGSVKAATTAEGEFINRVCA